MRQLERWYDLAPTRYENQVSANLNLSGEVYRYHNASDVLKLLQNTGVAQFEMKGNQIVINKQ